MVRRGSEIFDVDAYRNARDLAATLDREEVFFCDLAKARMLVSNLVEAGRVEWINYILSSSKNRTVKACLLDACAFKFPLIFSSAAGLITINVDIEKRTYPLMKLKIAQHREGLLISSAGLRELPSSAQIQNKLYSALIDTLNEEKSAKGYLENGTLVMEADNLQFLTGLPILGLDGFKKIPLALNFESISGGVLIKVKISTESRKNLGKLVMRKISAIAGAGSLNLGIVGPTLVDSVDYQSIAHLPKRDDLHYEEIELIQTLISIGHQLDSIRGREIGLALPKRANSRLVNECNRSTVHVKRLLMMVRDITGRERNKAIDLEITSLLEMLPLKQISDDELITRQISYLSKMSSVLDEKRKSFLTGTLDGSSHEAQ